jgi:hypothetical protein
MSKYQGDNLHRGSIPDRALVVGVVLGKKIHIGRR